MNNNKIIAFIYIAENKDYFLYGYIELQDIHVLGLSFKRKQAKKELMKIIKRQGKVIDKIKINKKLCKLLRLHFEGYNGKIELT